MKYDVIDKFFGDVFRERRKSQNWTTQDVADKIGIIRQTYYYYEIGERSMPMDVFKALCALWNIDWMDLIRQGQQVYIEALQDGRQD